MTVPAFFADEYYSTDEVVVQTGRPLLNKVLPRSTVC
jgi:hypothetical protein